MSDFIVGTDTMEFKVNDTIYLFNPLVGSFHRITDRSMQCRWEAISKHKRNLKEGDIIPFLEKGYVFDTKREEERKLQQLIEHQKKNRKSDLRVHILPTYQCNLDCNYCFESQNLRQTSKIIERKQIRRVYDFMDQKKEEHSVGKITIVLFGGEPLIANKEQKNKVEYILDQTQEREWNVEIVTNGVDLSDYVSLLGSYSDIIRAIQITIDGPKEIHDKRRVSPRGEGSFDKISQSVNDALKEELHIAIRTNIEEETINYLPSLANFFEGEGWFAQENFGSYIGITYDVESKKRKNSFPEILENILNLRLKNPKVRKMSIESWEPLQYVLFPFLKNKLRAPKVQFCGANYSDWLFDPYGDIYFCADGVGREPFKVGDYTTKSVELDQERVTFWRNMDITSTSCASDCPARLVCGGGCAFKKKLKTGSFDSNYCTDQVLSLLKVATKWLHNNPNVFEPEKEAYEEKLL